MFYVQEEPFSRFIAHLDADAFFVTCEQSIRPNLRNKPVVVGRERGIVTAASYEAKALGVTRGLPIYQLKRLYPQVIILPGNYELYAYISARMFEIMERFSGDVEKYGSDEGFIDLTGLEKFHKKKAYNIIHEIQETVRKELHISVSIGLSGSKTLAKIASAYNKPYGLCEVKKSTLVSFLNQLPIEKVWGIGTQLAWKMNQYGIRKTSDFWEKDISWVKTTFSKPVQQIWYELHGHAIQFIDSSKRETYTSISHSRTFPKVKNNPLFLLSQAIVHLERACRKARRYHLGTNNIYFFLKTQTFRYQSITIELDRVTVYPSDIVPQLRKAFYTLYLPNVEYRSVGIRLNALQPFSLVQQQLFVSIEKQKKVEQVYQAIDRVEKRFGKGSIGLGSSLYLN